MQPVRIVLAFTPSTEGDLFSQRKRRIVRIAQDEIRKSRALPCRIDAILDDPKPRDGALGILVPQRQQDGRADAKRLVRIPGCGERRVSSQGSGVACSSQSPMTEFQNPSTLQGAAKRKQTSISPSTIVQPPAESTDTIAHARPR